jgi:hypothetical protein
MCITNADLVTTGLGFIRVRHRKLNGGHPYLRAYRERNGRPPLTESVSFDLVRAVRIDGKPRHKFVLGLGSQQNVDDHPHGPILFWVDAVCKMKRHGLDGNDRRRLADEMSRKGARPPTIAQCEAMSAFWGDFHKDDLDEIMAWLRSSQSYRRARPASQEPRASRPHIRADHRHRARHQ